MYENSAELAENKLLVLYVIKSLRQPISKTQLNEIILENNFINYMQSDTSYTTSITYDEEKGYKYKIQLKDGSEAYSISDGRRNTIFYEKNGYLFSFMSNQSEEVIIDYINLSGILEYEY